MGRNRKKWKGVTFFLSLGKCRKRGEGVGRSGKEWDEFKPRKEWGLRCKIQIYSSILSL